MRSADRGLAIVAVLAAAAGCGGGGAAKGGGALPDTPRNVVPITVDGTLCGNAPGFVNEPCVSVTICSPGTQDCQTIDGVLLDTGSFGLRIFEQALTVPLTPVPAGAGQLAECVQYGDLSSSWGPVRIASVVLGREPSVQVPIQVIDAGFSARPSSCTNAQLGPASVGFNGILGVGPFAEDCGGACTVSASTGIYYTCSGTSCSGTTVPLAQQVVNPVAALPEDNNGVIVKLPPVSVSGAPSADGDLVLGIDTALDNVPGTVTVLDLDGHGEFQTSLAGTSFACFADTGSDALFFNPPAGVSLPVCTSDSSWFCPPTTASLTATNSGASGKGSVAVAFQIASFDVLSRSSSSVFSDLGGPGPGLAGFDWGLPFFLGRDVYVGIEGRISSLGTGPYVAH